MASSEKEELTYENIMENGYNPYKVGLTMFKWSPTESKEIYRWECILDLSKYLESMSPKVKVQISNKRCGVIIDNGRLIDRNQNTFEHFIFLEMSRDYFWCNNEDTNILYVTDIPSFINSLTEDKKKIFRPSMPFLRSYSWCGPPLYLPCSPKEIKDLQLKIDSIQHLLKQNDN